MKTLPLYIGIALVVVAIAAIVATVGRQADPVPRAAPLPPPMSVAALGGSSSQLAEEQGLTAVELALQDDQDSRKILYDQVGRTPAQIDASWLAQMCQYVHNEAELEAYWEQVLEQGRKYDIVYEAAHHDENKVLSRLPQVYIFEAREFIHTQVPNADYLRQRVPDLLALAVFRAWTSSVDDEMSRQRGRKKSVSEMLLAVGQAVVSEDQMALTARTEATIPEDIKSSYLTEATMAVELQVRLSQKAGQDTRQYATELIGLHEVALLEGYSLIKRLTQEARERYSQTTSSSAPATVAIGRWNSILNQKLLSLGKIYIDEALAEKTYRGRQQKYADLGFKALAMVFQRTKTGAAITVLREANRIQRYNFWQMGRAAWRQAQLAVKAGRADEADDLFFSAKQHYLQTLSRLERSKQPVVLREYQRLQGEITAWYQSKSAKADG